VCLYIEEEEERGDGCAADNYIKVPIDQVASKLVFILARVLSCLMSSITLTT
jgi:hypothetical protein